MYGQNTAPGAACLDEYLPFLSGKKVGLVVNHTATIGERHLVDTLLALGVSVQVVFAPEHGFRGMAGAGDLINDTIDEQSCLPIRSLYGKYKKPTPAMLADVEVLVFDIQDVGARFYTYISTLFYVAEACAENGLSLVVLDRPNPNGHYVDGPVLDTAYRSFVGIAPIPVVHGCTVGELARMYQGQGWLRCAEHLDLRVVPCSFYTHGTRYAPPIPPSPNLPDIRSVLWYPGICLFEGTKVSVGRGTAIPFQLIGYPDFPEGVCSFKPIPNAGAAKPVYLLAECCGVDLSGAPLDSLYALREINLSWLLYFYEKSPRKDDFFHKNNFFNLLAGTSALRKQVEQGCNETEIRDSWWPDLCRYRRVRERYLLYPE